MADTWWTLEQAVTWVSSRRPCGPVDACELVMTLAERGEIPVRYRRLDGWPVSIPPNARTGKIDWVEAAALAEAHHKAAKDWEQPAHSRMLGLGPGDYEYQAAAVQRLCESEPSKRGRPPKAFVPELAAAGGAWLALNGTPDSNSTLAGALHEECDRRGWTYGNTQINSLAAVLIAKYRAGLARS